MSDSRLKRDEVLIRVIFPTGVDMEEVLSDLAEALWDTADADLLDAYHDGKYYDADGELLDAGISHLEFTFE